MKANKILVLDKPRTFKPEDLNHSSRISDNGGNGGEPPMDKYVTHEELSHTVDNVNNKIDLSTEKLLRKMDERFNDIDRHFSDTELKINDIKNTANNNKEKINWVLYTAIGGIVISVITTIISNLLTK